MFLVEFRHFPRDRCVARAEPVGKFGEQGRHPPPGFEQDDRALRLGRAGNEAPPTGAAARGRKTEKGEGVRRQTRHGKRRRDGRWARDDTHRERRLASTPHEAVAGVRDQRCSRVRDQGEILSGLEAPQQAGHPLPLVVLVERYEPRRQAEPSLEAPGHPGVLTGDPSHPPEHPGRPGRQVLEVADRGRDHEERSRPCAARVRVAVHGRESTPLPRRETSTGAGTLRAVSGALSAVPSADRDAAARAFGGLEVVVTGAAGFIGRRLLDRLAAAGAHAAGIDRRPLDEAPADAVFHRGDLSHLPAPVSRRLAQADVVFHLAARNGHTASQEHPLADFEDNVAASLAVASALAPGARVVFTGTRQIYGSGQRQPADEDHAVQPPDVHSVHKETAEHLLRVLAGSRLAVLRLTNTYGPGQPLDGPGAGFTGAFLRQALSGAAITILGNPDLVRDVNHVDDVVEALLLAGRPGAPTGTWNLGGAPVTLGEFAAAACEAFGKTRRIRQAPLPARHRAIAVGDFRCDTSRIRRDLGWRPRMDLGAGLRTTVEALRGTVRHRSSKE